ncbi:hypothetical protein Hsar01_03826 [Haloferula sargassicola]|uniref:Transposase n=1 Tax=Haloferula sargassicola TaxID=490096 RepID=A0ABP9UV29_9BACT
MALNGRSAELLPMAEGKEKQVESFLSMLIRSLWIDRNGAYRPLTASDERQFHE